MRNKTAVVMVVLVLAVCACAQAKQVAADVSFLHMNPYSVTLAAGTDIVIVKHGFGGVDPTSYKSIKDLVKNTPIFFSLEASDASGVSIKVYGPKLVLIYQPETDTWSVRWEYQIKVKKLPSGTYTLQGTWTTEDGEVMQFAPTYMTIP